MLQIVGTDGSSTPKSLATKMRVTQATVTTLVDKLVKAGMVQRVPSQLDRRQTNVMITEAGRATLADAPDALQQRYVSAFSELADWEQAQLVASLERVADMLDARDIDASPVLAVGAIHTPKQP